LSEIKNKIKVERIKKLKNGKW